MDSSNRSLPRHSTNGSKRSRANSVVDARLSVIAEDGALPPVPEKSRNNRTFSRGWAFNPPRHSFEESPPNYSFWDVTGPKGEKLTDVRNNKHIAQRGGWRRICLIFWLVLIAIIALAVGLGVGLRKNHPSRYLYPSINYIAKLTFEFGSPTASATPTSTPALGASFPVGFYAFNTFLKRASTDCTSNATTWTCAPYNTYDNSPSQSKATFYWNITTSTPGSPTNFSISSSDNPFAITFTNASLELVDTNLQSEHYHFKASDDKMVVPNGASNVHCYYNGTTVEGNLYTRLKQVFSDVSYTSTVSSVAPASTGGAYSGGQQNWPYAIEFTQSIGGGTGVPDCYRMEDGTAVERLTQGLETKASNEVCSCYYKSSNP